MSKKVIYIAVLVIVVLLFGAWIITKSNKVTTPPVDQTVTQQPTTPQGQNMVSISANGFSPSSITIKAGDSVTWTNTDSASHTVNSDPHPTHTDYPPLNSVGMIAPGDKKSFTFPEAGTYKYHDHLNPDNHGTVIVQ